MQNDLLAVNYCLPNAQCKYTDYFDLNDSHVHHCRWMRSTQFQRWGQWLEVLYTGQYVEIIVSLQVKWVLCF